jgi:hypothetical protein
MEHDKWATATGNTLFVCFSVMLLETLFMTVTIIEADVSIML